MKLVANIDSGLSCRILGLISCMHWAEKTDRKLSICWKPNSARCPCELKDIIKNEFDTVDYFRTRAGMFFDNSLSECRLTTTNVLGTSWDKVPSDKELHKQLKKLVFQDDILNDVEQRFPSGNNPLMGVHIRRRKILVPPNIEHIFIEEMNRWDGDFLIVGDTKEILYEYKELYGDRAIIIDRGTITRATTQEMKDAIVDVLLLSKCDFIVRSGNSGFSHLATLFNMTPNKSLWGKIRYERRTVFV